MANLILLRFCLLCVLPTLFLLDQPATKCFSSSFCLHLKFSLYLRIGGNDDVGNIEKNALKTTTLFPDARLPR